MVPEGLLTFLGSLYKEGAKTTSGTLVYIWSERKIFFFLLKNLQIAAFLYSNVIFHGKIAESTVGDV